MYHNAQPHYYPAGHQLQAGTWGPPSHPQTLASGAVVDPSLPLGWLKQWNQQYQTWFFINTSTQPPLSQWVHPGPPPAHQLNPPQLDNSRQTGSGTNGHGGAFNQGNMHQTNNFSTSQVPYQNHNARPIANGNFPSGNPSTYVGNGTNMNYNPSAPVQPPTSQVSKIQSKAPNSNGKAIMAAGLTAMGGIAVGALVSHEWKEHQKHEQGEKEEAYFAGFHQAEEQSEDHSTSSDNNFSNRDDGYVNDSAPRFDSDENKYADQVDFDDQDSDGDNFSVEDEDERDW